ncbi:MAG: AraC family transcriptional regulator [Chryseobacterium sp.]|jgi:AraC-like DNA-binding protein|uniref:AraC family transcriptional regulator n=1 Tax=Chryseobacterium sp. TaxID=1871047 RepID=UPI0028243A7B|nr:helix-turn-helix transcriptional regulator [Chryseobacterium sp.]MDR2235263.1 AraC family transcriptional regulator [Chryseobacterium sp.]
MNDKNIPVQRITEIQKRLSINHDIIYHQMKGLCPLYSPIRHDFFSLILFEKATGRHIIEGKEYPVHERQLHMVFPGQSHFWEYSSEADIYQLFISGKLFERLEGFMQFPALVYRKKPVIEMSREDFRTFVHEFKDIGDELKNPSPVMNEIIYSKMKIITRNISREARKNAEYLDIYESHPVLFDFMTLLNKDYRPQRSKKYYADQLGVNANYLNILCKKYFEYTATEIIQKHIAEKIKCKLEMTEEPLKDIAFDFGFHNYGYFSGFMKKYTGLTPKKFRETTTSPEK